MRPRLSLKTERLAELTTEDLVRVVGGDAAATQLCSALGGCNSAKACTTAISCGCEITWNCPTNICQ